MTGKSTPFARDLTNQEDKLVLVVELLKANPVLGVNGLLLHRGHDVHVTNGEISVSISIM